MKNRPKRILLLISAILFFTMSLCSGGIKAEAAVSGQAIVDYAKQFLGRPYVYGATGPNSFDCSGLTSYVYNHAAGINIGRTTYNQINAGREVSRNELQAGDLVFTHSAHVGIYVGNNQMVHAPQTGDVVKISTITKFWRARRIVSNVNVVDTSSKEIKAICNTGFYAWKYSDLANAYGSDSLGLYNHFINYGVKEARAASQTFDVGYYLKHNPDLSNALGANNYAAAFEHFKEYGYKENRDLSPIFNMKYYIEKNPDIKAVCGNDYYGIMNHFLYYGMKEGRASSPNFNLQVYKDNYEDLRAAYGNDSEAYYNHYLLYGIAEGRVAK